MTRTLGAWSWRALPPLALVALLWHVVDVDAVLARLRGADPRWLLAGVALVQLQVILSALRWQLTAQRLGQPLALGRAVREYYLATLLNRVLPGGMAGDAARALRAPGDVPTGLAVQGVVIERLGGQLALFAVTVAGLASWPLLVDEPAPRAALVALAVVPLLVLVGVFLVRASAARGPVRWRRAAANLGPAFRRSWFEDGAWLTQGVLSLAVTAGYIGVFAVAALASGAPLPTAALATIVPLALASMLLPFSVGGWGLREGAAAALWPLVGLAPEAGVAASVLYGLVSLVGSAPGLLVATAAAFERAAPRASRQPGGET